MRLCPIVNLFNVESLRSGCSYKNRGKLFDLGFSRDRKLRMQEAKRDTEIVKFRTIVHFLYERTESRTVMV